MFFRFRRQISLVMALICAASYLCSIAFTVLSTEPDDKNLFGNIFLLLLLLPVPLFCLYVYKKNKDNWYDVSTRSRKVLWAFFNIVTFFDLFLIIVYIIYILILLIFMPEVVLIYLAIFFVQLCMFLFTVWCEYGKTGSAGMIVLTILCFIGLTAATVLLFWLLTQDISNFIQIMTAAISAFCGAISTLLIYRKSKLFQENPESI